MTTLKLALLSAAMIAALTASGCGGGQRYSPPASVAAPTSKNFTRWSKSDVFSLSEANAPVDMDTLVFAFDDDANPDAYSDLLPSG